MSLKKELEGAQVVKEDKKNKFTIAWFGGHGIHVYNGKGKEVAFWNVESAQDSLTKEEAEQSIDKNINTSEYLNLIEDY